MNIDLENFAHQLLEYSSLDTFFDKREFDTSNEKYKLQTYRNTNIFGCLVNLENPQERNLQSDKAPIIAELLGYEKVPYRTVQRGNGKLLLFKRTNISTRNTDFEKENKAKIENIIKNNGGVDYAKELENFNLQLQNKGVARYSDNWKEQLKSKFGIEFCKQNYKVLFK